MLPMLHSVFLIILVSIIFSLFAQEVYIWDNENPSFYFPDPETGYSVSGSDAIISLLDASSISYNYGTALPTDLSQYNLIFILLGSFCES